MASKKEMAEVNAMWDEIEEKKKRLEEFEKIDSQEARYRAGAMKRSINRLQEKCNHRMLELLRKN